MTQQELIQTLMMVGIAALGWFARTLWSDVNDIKDDLMEIKENLPLFYVRKDDFKEFRHNVMDSLHRIELLLSNKVDK